MSSLRERLADALCVFLTDYNDTGIVHLAEGVDRLLSLPGIAIVELPEPGISTDPDADATWNPGADTEIIVWADRSISDYEGAQYDSTVGRAYAASILAAVKFAERPTP